MNVSRRAALSWAATLPWSARPARGARLGALPLRIGVCRHPDTKGPVVPDCWVDAQVTLARRLIEPHARLLWTARWTVPPEHARLETVQDRDALAALLAPHVVDVFVVERLRDIHDPKRFRMGVRWRWLRNVRKNYIIVAASARPSVLAHELGHYLGHGHSSIEDNVMSYRRSDDPTKLHFNRTQKLKMAARYRALLASKEVYPAPEESPHRWCRQN